MNADFNVGALPITGQVAGVPWASVVVCQCGRNQYFAAWGLAKHTLMKLGCYSSFSSECLCDFIFFSNLILL